MSTHECTSFLFMYYYVLLHNYIEKNLLDEWVLIMFSSLQVLRCSTLTNGMLKLLTACMLSVECWWRKGLIRSGLVPSDRLSNLSLLRWCLFIIEEEEEEKYREREQNDWHVDLRVSKVFPQNNWRWWWCVVCYITSTIEYKIRLLLLTINENESNWSCNILPVNMVEHLLEDLEKIGELF